MKKSLFFIGLIPLVSLPIIALSSCSTTEEEVNLHSQYDLFSPNLVKQDRVSENLVLSIDQNNIGDIYSTPENLLSEITFNFSFDKNEKTNSLILYVQIYNYLGEIIKFSTDSDKKMITTIENFHELSVAQQANIDLQYSNFMSLSLTGTSTTLPSYINSFKSIAGSDVFVEDKKYKYNFEFTPNNTQGKVVVNLNLTSDIGYPLKPFGSIAFTKEVTGFMTKDTYQENVDNLYKGTNEIANIDLSKPEFASVQGKYFASGISNTEELVAFYKILKINIPCFLEHKPVCECTFDSEVIIASLDSSATVSLTINFYDKVTKEMVKPSSDISKYKKISGFTKTSNELLKATMDAYDKYKQFRAKEIFQKTLPSQHQDVTDISLISEDPINVGEFTVEVDIFALKGTRAVPLKKTFTFRPQPFILQASDDGGMISSQVVLEVKIENGSEINWIKIKPPKSFENDDKIIFGHALHKVDFYITGFLTTLNKEANDMYETLNNQIVASNNLVMAVAANDSEFNNVDFNALWLNLYTGVDGRTDPLGIESNVNFKIKYVFSTHVNTSVSGSTTYRWVSVKASVNSVFTDYEYDFLNVNNLSPIPNFEFNFGISFDQALNK